MERLTARLDAVQAKLLELIERNSTKLEDHVTYWGLVRQENVIYYYARQHGINRLGLNVVPPKNVAEARSKKAIELQLTLESLLKSQYGRESWTMAETSLENWSVEPERTLKKGPQNVEVWYDGDSDNAMQYTLWRDIYYLDNDDKWRKSTSGVQYAGIYFFEGTYRHYYVAFAHDAGRFSNTGTWEVHFNNRVLSPGSSATTLFGRGAPEEAPAGSRGSRKSQSLPVSTPLSSSTPAPAQRRKRPPAGPQNGAPASRRRRLGQGESGPALEPSRPTAPSAEEVGRRSQTVGRGPHTRLERLVLEARDPPVLIVTGGVNSLKCFRHRLHRGHKDKYVACSTGFHWVKASSGEKGKEGKVLVAFSSRQQRQTFLSTVPIPSGFTVATGNLDAL
ncbi:E2 protein [Tree shrew papillomavirus 1]|uniref:Regulatory protein E2 n=1 Tax=Tree shrew papillomavirus 1 TaxID=2562515 RepID=A0AAF1D2G1_9PAPI|nr:E2 protein [Tree shrew papillomavirus 1]